MKRFKIKKYINVIIILIIVLVLFCVFRILFSQDKKNENLHSQESEFIIERHGDSLQTEYVDKMFDMSQVHKIEIFMDEADWDLLQNTALDKKWFNCDIKIDGEKFDNVAIRTKGGGTLKGTVSNGDNKYGFKIEFDHNNEGQTYHGLDKLVLNNCIYDKSFVKDYVAYDMMQFIGVPAPYTSYIDLSINDMRLGLYLGVEAVEESFLKRNYGDDYGELYKPNKGTLEYVGDNIISYNALLENSKTDVNDDDKARVIEAIKNMESAETIQEAINLNEILNFFVVESFLSHYDGYLGKTAKNFYLYEKNGRIEMIPWDYDAIYSSFMINNLSDEDSEYLKINMPIDNPLIINKNEVRPLWSNLMSDNSMIELYHGAYLNFLKGYFDSGYFENVMNSLHNLIYDYFVNNEHSKEDMSNFEISFKNIHDLMLSRKNAVENQIIKGISDKEKLRIDAILNSGE